jgi:hypothetical protein
MQVSNGNVFEYLKTPAAQGLIARLHGLQRFQSGDYNHPINEYD